jgi:hypothetical protein
MNGNDCTLIECFEEFQEAQFDAGWCEAVGLAGGLEIDETPSIEECERIYKLTAEPYLLAAVGSAS